MFKKILIARRGEAAARVARTCKNLGITAVALYSDADVLRGEEGRDGAPVAAVGREHMEACDEVVRVEAGPDGSVLPEAVVAAAKEAGVDAVHPGYVAESAHVTLGRLLEKEGLPFVGADPDMLEALLDLRALQEAAERAGVRTVPRGAALVGSLADAYEQAEHVGYPVRLRSARQGDPYVSPPAEDDDALERIWDAEPCRAARESGTPLLVERSIERPRVLEVLLITDGTGEATPLCEMESSLRTEHGAVLVETPSPELINRADGEAMRNAMFDAAIRLVGELHCVGLVSVELLVDADARLWIDGVRVGLPRHHAACELVTGLDLVALQLSVACGEPLPAEVAVVQASGHAVCASLLARGTDARDAGLSELRFPPGPQRRIRVETSSGVGAPITFDDWPLIAKVGCFAPIRHQAVLTLDRVIAETLVAPFDTNAGLLRTILASESFRAGQYDAGFVDAQGERAA